MSGAMMAGKSLDRLCPALLNSSGLSMCQSFMAYQATEKVKEIKDKVSHV